MSIKLSKLFTVSASWLPFFSLYLPFDVNRPLHFNNFFLTSEKFLTRVSDCRRVLLILLIFPSSVLRCLRSVKSFFAAAGDSRGFFLCQINKIVNLTTFEDVLSSLNCLIIFADSFFYVINKNWWFSICFVIFEGFISAFLWLFI